MKTKMLLNSLACGLVLLITSSSVYSFEHVSWLPGSTPPAAWEISPANPTTADIISFQGPTSVYSNACYAEAYAGGSAMITVNPSTHTIEIWFMPPAPTACIALWDPVCGLEGYFGPLTSGNWTLFSNNPVCTFSLDFSVENAIEVLAPNGGQSWAAGNTKVITWQSNESISSFLVEYSTNNGQDWVLVDTVLNPDPNENTTIWETFWIIPDVNSQQCLVRVSDESIAYVGDISDDVFTIFVCQQSFFGDLNGDCYVNLGDFALFAMDWLACANPYDPNCL